MRPRGAGKWQSEGAVKVLEKGAQGEGRLMWRRNGAGDRAPAEGGRHTVCAAGRKTGWKGLEERTKRGVAVNDVPKGAVGNSCATLEHR